MYDSSYSYFKIDCGGSPSLTFYSDAGCTTMGSTISQGTCETTLSSSYAYQFSCPGSASTASSPPPPPVGSVPALETYADGSCSTTPTYTLAPSQQCTALTGTSKWFKIICGVSSPSLTFYMDSSCSTTEQSLGWGVSCGSFPSISGSSWFSFICPASTIPPSLPPPSPPPPVGSSSSDAALKAYSDASCTGSALTTTLAPSEQCTPITISGNSMYFKLLCSDPSPYVQFYTDSSCTSIGSYSTFSQSACQGQDSLGGSSGTWYSFTCPSSYVSWHPNAGMNAGLPRTLLS